MSGLIGEITGIIYYLTAFWSVVVVNCAKPTNWEYCFPVDKWLMPYVNDYVEFKTKEPYYKEKEILKALNKP